MYVGEGGGVGVGGGCMCDSYFNCQKRCKRLYTSDFEYCASMHHLVCERVSMCACICICRCEIEIR